ncbi:MAG: chemotaxis response regulator protein-glutamate methylesterase [Erythrobacter sp.]|nr:chemotaxis response regulator protein-glutamate methylesterase [Erythrobacter sp.]
MSVRVLIVDDSAVMRALITRKLMEDKGIEVVGTARDAAEARKLIKALDPDVVTLDVEMPGMDGLSFLEKIMELRPTPVIIVSGSTGPGAEATARAMQLGAINCYAKSTEERSIADDDGGLLVQLVREAAQVKLPPARKKAAPARSSTTLRPSATPRSALPTPDLIVIGSSTGGVEALHTVLSGFPAQCPPTLVVQHVHGSFAEAIARSLDADVPPRVSLANPDRALSPGEVVLASGDTHHLMVAPRSNPFSRFRCALRPDDPVSGHRPSVDALFHSAAQQAGEKTIGILLTGMGRDGAEGLHALAQAGAHTIAQDKESCVVFGMPRAAIELGAAKSVLPLGQIAPRIFGSASGTPSRVSASQRAHG